MKELRAENAALRGVIALGLKAFGPDCAYVAPEVLGPRREAWIEAARVAVGKSS